MFFVAFVCDSLFILTDLLSSVNTFFDLILNRKRRGWDSNPRALTDKRISRPPRYDHFDTSAYLLVFLNAR